MAKFGMDPAGPGIDKRLDKPGTVFVAVGAGHLAGKDSVQDQLAAYGHEAERVPAQ